MISPDIFLYGVSIKARMMAYLCGCLTISALGSLSPPAQLNVWKELPYLNDYGVKVGWLYVSVPVVAFHAILCLSFSGGKIGTLRRPFIRLMVATLAWWGMTAAFRFCDDRHKFDPSGHLYLITLGVSVLLEEVKGCPNLDQFEATLTMEIQRRAALLANQNVIPGLTPLSYLSQDDFRRLSLAFPFVKPAIFLVKVAVAVIVSVAEFMTLGTWLFYHTYLEKATATFLAALLWYIGYHLALKRNWRPGTELLIRLDDN